MKDLFQAYRVGRDDAERSQKDRGSLRAGARRGRIGAELVAQGKELAELAMILGTSKCKGLRPHC